MSLPLTRRIVRAALLVAAGAAPLVGTAGAANAADLAGTPNLAGGLTHLDGANLAGTVDGAAQQVGDRAGDVGGKAVKSSLPPAGRTVGGIGGTAVPTVHKAAGAAAGTSGSLLGDAAGTTARNRLPGGVSAQPLPLQANGLPLGG
jgi:hypothetical protein